MAMQAVAQPGNDLSTFAITSERGFLPPVDPLRELPRALDAWEKIAGELPKLLMSNQLRSVVGAMPRLDPVVLKTPAEIERAMLLLSYIGHAYVWGDAKAADRIPATLA